MIDRLLVGFVLLPSLVLSAPQRLAPAAIVDDSLFSVAFASMMKIVASDAAQGFASIRSRLKSSSSPVDVWTTTFRLPGIGRAVHFALRAEPNQAVLASGEGNEACSLACHCARYPLRV